MTQALATIATERFTDEQIALIKRTVAKDATNDELSLFLYTAQSRGLDPLLRQIHAVSRYDKRQSRNIMSIQVGIDGYRLIADRTGSYAGNDDPVFEYDSGPEGPSAAIATVYKIVQGMRCPFVARARWSEYFPGDGAGGFMWKKMPHTMLGKCAEALALRKAFPAEMSGLYIHEEMAQAGGQDIIDAPTPPSVPIRARDVEDAPRQPKPKTREELREQYLALLDKAIDLGVELDDDEWTITEDVSVEVLRDKGPRLAEQVKKHRAQSAEPAEAVF